MASSFLDILKEHGIEGPLPRSECGGPAAQAVKPGGESPEKESPEQTWDFAFATGIECSNPLVVDPQGKPLRRDLLQEGGHYDRCRDDPRLVKERGTPVLRYGLPNPLIHLGPDKYDWSFADEALGEIRRLGI